MAYGLWPVEDGLPARLSPVTVVAVLSMKGGVGKTTASLGLASAAWHRKLRTLVIDLDPQANATMSLDIRSAPFTANDVLSDARPGVAVDAVLDSGWGDTVKVIAAERSLENRSVELGRTSAQRLRTALATAPRHYDLVIIDCPPSLGELTRNALTAANQAIVVTEPTMYAVRGAAEALEAVDIVRSTTNPTLRTAALLVNRYRPDDRDHRLHLSELHQAHGELVFAKPLADCQGIPHAQRAGAPLHSWNSPGSREAAETFDDLLNHILPPPPPEQPMINIRRFFT